MSKKTQHSELVENEAFPKKAKLDEWKMAGPNILITGTPGVGKSALCDALKKKDPEGIQCINIGKFARDNDFLGVYDEVYQCHELDEDKIIDELEGTMQRQVYKRAYQQLKTSPEREKQCLCQQEGQVHLSPARLFRPHFFLPLLACC